MLPVEETEPRRAGGQDSGARRRVREGLRKGRKGRRRAAAAAGK